MIFKTSKVFIVLPPPSVYRGVAAPRHPLAVSPAAVFPSARHLVALKPPRLLRPACVGRLHPMRTIPLFRGGAAPRHSLPLRARPPWAGDRAGARLEQSNSGRPSSAFALLCAPHIQAASRALDDTSGGCALRRVQGSRSPGSGFTVSGFRASATAGGRPAGRWQRRRGRRLPPRGRRPLRVLLRVAQSVASPRTRGGLRASVARAWRTPQSARRTPRTGTATPGWTPEEKPTARRLGAPGAKRGVLRVCAARRLRGEGGAEGSLRAAGARQGARVAAQLPAGSVGVLRRQGVQQRPRGAPQPLSGHRPRLGLGDGMADETFGGWRGGWCVKYVAFAWSCSGALSTAGLPAAWLRCCFDCGFLRGLEATRAAPAPRNTPHRTPAAVMSNWLFRCMVITLSRFTIR